MRIGGKADLNEHTRHAGLAKNLVVRGYGLPGIGGIDLAQLLLDEDGQLLTARRALLIESLRSATTAVLRKSVYVYADEDICPSTIGQISPFTQLHVNIIAANQKRGKTLVFQSADKGFCYRQVDILFHKPLPGIPSSDIAPSVSGINRYFKAVMPLSGIGSGEDQNGRESCQQQHNQNRRVDVPDPHGMKNDAHQAGSLHSGEAYRMRVVMSFMPSAYTFAFSHSRPLR
jgi:hypothetical protein